MSFKEATRSKTRFQTTKGPLSAEQLWDLSLEDLDNTAVKLQDEYESSKGKSFLNKRTVKDKGLKLQFDVVLEVLETKKEESEKAKQALEDKAYNQKILEVMAGKKDKALEGKSLKELESMLR